MQLSNQCQREVLNKRNCHPVLRSYLLAPLGPVSGYGHGILRSISGNPGAVADIVPVDAVVNLMCAVALETSRQYGNSKERRGGGGGGGGPEELPVYNMSSGRQI